MAVMLALWYPPPLFGAMGGKLLVLLIVGVDVAIGPLLTLIVFNPRKQELPFDLSIIALLQLSALAYGVYAMHAGRPVFIVFVENEFAVISAAAIEDDARQRARPEFRTFPERGPVIVAVEMPTDINARNDIVFASMGGLGAQHMPQYYVPYVGQAAQVAATSQPLERLAVVDAAAKAEVAAVLTSLGRPPTELRFLPMTTEFATLTALVDAKTGTLLAIAAAKPVRYGGVPVLP